MQQQQQPDFMERWKRNTNVIHWLAVIHQRAIILPFRKYFGTQALAFPCFFAMILMFFWWLFSHDDLMLVWGGFWLVCLIVRRIEAVKINGQVHSQYDGYSSDSMRFTKSERIAKLVVEPIQVAILALIVTKWYEYQGWNPRGLPWFLWIGVVTLPFVASVQNTIWDNRLRSMQDGKIENQAAMRDFHDKYGH